MEMSIPIGPQMRLQTNRANITVTGCRPVASPCTLGATILPSICWTTSTKTATVNARGIKIHITQGNTYIEANGRYFASGEPVRNIDGRLYLPVRLITAAFASTLTWNGATYTVIEDRRAAIEYAIKNARRGDIILLAGKGHEEYMIDRTGRHAFSEREICRELVKKYC